MFQTCRPIDWLELICNYLRFALSISDHANCLNFNIQALILLVQNNFLTNLFELCVKSVRFKKIRFFWNRIRLIIISDEGCNKNLVISISFIFIRSQFEITWIICKFIRHTTLSISHNFCCLPFFLFFSCYSSSKLRRGRQVEISILSSAMARDCH